MKGPGGTEATFSPRKVRKIASDAAAIALKEKKAEVDALPPSEEKKNREQELEQKRKEIEDRIMESFDRSIFKPKFHPSVMAHYDSVNERTKRLVGDYIKLHIERTNSRILSLKGSDEYRVLLKDDLLLTYQCADIHPELKEFGIGNLRRSVNAVAMEYAPVIEVDESPPVE